MRHRQRILPLLLASLSTVVTTIAYHMEANSINEPKPSHNLPSSSQRHRLRQHKDILATVERDVAEIDKQNEEDQMLDEQLLVVEVQDDGLIGRHLTTTPMLKGESISEKDTGGNDADRSLARQQKPMGNAPGVNRQRGNRGSNTLENNKPNNNNNKQSSNTNNNRAATTHHRGANQKIRAANNSNGKVRLQNNQNRNQKRVGRKNNNNRNRNQQIHRNSNSRGRNGGIKNKMKKRNGDINIGSNGMKPASGMMISNLSGKPYIQQVSTSWNGPPPPLGWMDKPPPQPQGWPGPWQAQQFAWKSPEWYVAGSGKSSKLESLDWYGKPSKKGKGRKSSKGWNDWGKSKGWSNSVWNDIWDDKPWKPSGDSKQLDWNKPPVWKAPPDWQSPGEDPVKTKPEYPEKTKPEYPSSSWKPSGWEKKDPSAAWVSPSGIKMCPCPKPKVPLPLPPRQDKPQMIPHPPQWPVGGMSPYSTKTESDPLNPVLSGGKANTVGGGLSKQDLKELKQKVRASGGTRQDVKNHSAANKDDMDGMRLLSIWGAPPKSSWGSSSGGWDGGKSINGIPLLCPCKTELPTPSPTTYEPTTMEPEPPTANIPSPPTYFPTYAPTPTGVETSAPTPAAPLPTYQPTSPFPSFSPTKGETPLPTPELVEETPIPTYEPTELKEQTPAPTSSEQTPAIPTYLPTSPFPTFAPTPGETSEPTAGEQTSEPTAAPILVTLEPTTNSPTASPTTLEPTTLEPTTTAPSPPPIIVEGTIPTYSPTVPWPTYSPTAQTTGTKEPSAFSIIISTPDASSSPTINIPNTPSPSEQSIVDIAAGNPDFSILVEAVTAAGLVDTLSGEGPFTVFAPTNEAFAALPEGTLDTLLLPENINTLTEILTYHVVAGEVPSTSLVTGDVETVNGEPVAVAVSDSGITVNDANVFTPDIVASNGIIHIIDKVLLPPEESEESEIDTSSPTLSLTPPPVSEITPIDTSSPTLALTPPPDNVDTIPGTSSPTLAVTPPPVSVVDTITEQDCTEVFCEQQISSDYVLRHKINVPSDTTVDICDGCTISMEAVYSGEEAWTGIGFSTNGEMVGSEVVIGIGPGVPLKYNLLGKSVDTVQPMPDNQQTLIDASVTVDEDGNTLLRFTKIMAEPDEIEISPFDNIMLWAYGSSDTLAYHAARGSFDINLSSGDTQS